TVLPAVPLPVMVGLLTLVMWSPAMPESDAGSNVNAVGTAGGVVSIVIDSADERTDTLPAASVALAVIWWVPALSAVVMVALQAPVAALVTTPVPMGVAPPSANKAMVVL